MRYYVTGLDYDASDDDVRSMITAAGVSLGPQSLYVARDYKTARGKGFCFVESGLSLDEIRALLGSVESRPNIYLRVQPARPRLSDEDPRAA
jgi:hypothetical protein